MIYLKSIHWYNDDYIEKRYLKKKLFPLDIEFHNPVTIIVGKNGSGKTRLLKNIVKKSDNLEKLERCEPNSREYSYTQKLLETIHIDLVVNENMPHIRIINYDTSEVYSNTFNGEILQLARHWKSNGETKDILIDRIKNCADDMRKSDCHGVMLIDELDNSLDYIKQRKFARILKKSSDVIQFIVATHNIPFIAQFDEIFDIENKNYIKTDEYLNKIIRSKK